MNQNYEGSCPELNISKGQGHLEVLMSETGARFKVRISTQLFLDFREVLENQYLKKF